MKHPNREQWVGFLYEDCDPVEKSELTDHLKSCATCREQLKTWRATASALNAYKVAARSSLSLWERVGVRVRSWVPLSAAAAILIAAGIALGSTWQTRANSDQAQIIANLRNRIENSEAENARTQKLLVDLSQTILENRAQDQATLLTVAQRLQATRKDLETVAVLTDAGLKNTENQLVRLASYTP